MKRYFYLLIAGFAGLVLASCEGPMGPPGADGTNGADGTPGVDGNATCLVCHNLDTKSMVTDEYEESSHAAGGAVARSTNNDCAKCHSHEGMHETLRTGKDTTAAGIPIPTRIDCETCHGFHQTLDFTEDGADYALYTVEPIKFMMYPLEDPVDFGNSSNLCANCHQTRTAAPGYDANDANWDQVAGTYAVTSSRFGPHHGPQGNILAGIGGYQPGVDGSDHPHKAAGCAACHMSRDGADGKANHTFEVSVSACLACHPGATNFDINGYVTEMQGLGATLKAALVAAGMLNNSNDNAVNGTYSLDDAGALFNYRSIFVEQAKSLGVHNPDYCKAMIEKGITIMSK